MGVGSIHEPAREVPSNIEDHSVVVAMPVVVGVENLTKAGIEPDGIQAVVDDQIVGNGIDINTIGDISDGVAVADDVVGVGSVITNAGLKGPSQLALQSCR